MTNIFKYITFLFCTILLISCSNSNNSLTNQTKDKINIHINQVALELFGSKSAIVSSLFPLKTHKFNIITKQGTSIYQGNLVALPQFTEWKQAQQARHYYKADFSEVIQAGNYQLKLINNQHTIISPTFSLAQQNQFTTTVTALLYYFKDSRNDERFNWQQDKTIRIYDSQRFVDVRGGYNDAGGDTGKYLSHLSYANYFNPQQLAFVPWALAKSYQMLEKRYQDLQLSKQIIAEIFWGADYLHRILDPQGYFYMTVFDQWNTNNAERVVTAYVGADGIYTEHYQAAFREGAGVAIAALARAYRLAKQTKQQGEYSAEQYLSDAEKAFAHLQAYNKNYCDDGEENIIDDYTALLAATELYKSTKKTRYLQAARQRATNLSNRLTKQGWFISNNIDSKNKRPFYHASDAGFPLLALTEYLTIEQQKNLRLQAKNTLLKHLTYQLNLNKKVSNPFNYARQSFKTYKNGKLSKQYQEGFFMPHANETQYWWQGESARLSSLATAALLAIKPLELPPEKAKPLQQFAQNQLDWTLGRNPYHVTMLHGFGKNNPIAYQGLTMVKGGISNGITGSKHSDAGRGIEWAPESDWHNWRWVEQWLPHSTWFLLATSATAITKYDQPNKTNKDTLHD